MPDPVWDNGPLYALCARLSGGGAPVSEPVFDAEVDRLLLEIAALQGLDCLNGEFLVEGAPDPRLFIDRQISGDVAAVTSQLVDVRDRLVADKREAGWEVDDHLAKARAASPLR